MKVAALALAMVVAVATADASDHGATNGHRRLRIILNNACQKECPSGKWCANGPVKEQKCRAPTHGSSECFDEEGGYWVSKCRPDMICGELNKCETRGTSPPNHGTPGAPVCFKRCPTGQFCARNPEAKQECRAPTPNTSECFDPMHFFWVYKCPTGTSCKGGKCITS